MAAIRKSFYLTRLALLAIAGLLAVVLVQPALSRGAAEEARLVPPPAVDLPAGTASSAVAVFAGGCFWGVQGVFQHVEGVLGAVSGYAGGAASTAQYRLIGSGLTGHAEAVQVRYDPRRVSYGQLLQVYFSVAHDPTQLNRQGPDRGTQYRSTIFPADAEQARVAQAYIAQLDRAKAFPAAIVTTLEPGRTFYPAEDYHQDFLERHPDHGYIAYYDLPKLAALKQLFPKLYRDKAVLVGNPGR
ncbi:MAG: peptide-methionine (S)-S-oxide reductase MsrA [Stagnimonas sp.]|nr:peptide-methionine (S)-S-oxide reductase MsrA [Stagnimonas sp.]